MLVAMKLTPWILMALTRAAHYMIVNIDCTLCGSHEAHCIQLPENDWTPLRPNYSIEGRLLEAQISHRHLHPEYQSFKLSPQAVAKISGYRVFQKSDLTSLEKTLNDEIAVLKSAQYVSGIDWSHHEPELEP